MTETQGFRKDILNGRGISEERKGSLLYRDGVMRRRVSSAWAAYRGLRVVLSSSLAEGDKRGVSTRGGAANGPQNGRPNPSAPALLLLTWSLLPRLPRSSPVPIFSTVDLALLSLHQANPSHGPTSTEEPLPSRGAPTNRRCQNHLGPNQYPRNPTTQQGPPPEELTRGLRQLPSGPIFLGSLSRTLLHRSSSGLSNSLTSYPSSIGPHSPEGSLLGGQGSLAADPML